MKLIKSGNRLVIIKGSSRFSFPTGYYFEAGKVFLYSLDDSTTKFEAPLSEVLDETNTPFASLELLEAFLFPLLGFNTASGGSEVVGTTVDGIAGHFTATGAGTAVKGVRGSGLAAQFVGKQLIEKNDSGSNNDSSILEVNATDLGSLPAPRVTTVQKEAIPFPATGLLIFDLNRLRYEFFNGTYWQGITTQFISIGFGPTWSPTDSQTVAFGSHVSNPFIAASKPPFYEVILRGNGVIRGCDLNTLSTGNSGTNENWSLYVRHNGNDYLVQTIGLATSTRKFSNQSLNIPYVDGDIVRMILVNPSWGTNPTGVTAAGFLKLQ